MRLWLSVTIALVTFIGRSEAVTTPKIKECPPDSACAIFVDGKCDGKTEKGGVFWDKDHPSCKDATYDILQAGFEIKPVGLRKWTVVVTYLAKDAVQKIGEIAFRFVKAANFAEFMFVNESAVALVRRKGNEKKTKEYNSTIHSMTKLEPIQESSKKFNRYSFDIEAGEEKLITLFDAEKVDFIRKRAVFLSLTDKKFSEKLEGLTNCDFKEIKQACYDTCDDITVSNSKLLCPSKLWFQWPSEAGLARTWYDVDQIRCNHGSWQTDGKRGNNWIGNTTEVQCSADEPSKYTTLLKVSIGCFVGGILLLIGGGVGGFFLLRWWRLRNAKKPSKEVLGIKVRNLRDQWAWPDEKEEGGASTPSKRMQEFTAKTDYEILKTEILDKETTGNQTNIEVLQTEQGLGVLDTAGGTTPTSPAPGTVSTPNQQQEAVDSTTGPAPRKFASDV